MVPTLDREQIFGGTVYMHLWSVDDIDTIDGWSLFKIKEETADSISCVGLMTLLPSGEIPMEFSLNRVSHGIAWQLTVAAVDADLPSKLWNAVYLYGTGERQQPQWNRGMVKRGVLE